MNKKILIFGAAGVAFVLVLIVNILNTRPTDPGIDTNPTSVPQESSTGTLDISTGGQNDPDAKGGSGDGGSAQQPSSAGSRSEDPGVLYSHRGLEFRLPSDWEPSTSSPADDVVMAYPRGAESIYDLPRVQIIAERTSDPDYIDPEERYANHKEDRELLKSNRLMRYAFRADHPVPASETTDIAQEVVAVFENGATAYTIHYQYRGSVYDFEQEDTLRSILESLRYR
jgi:hypothetical protein